MLKIKFGSFVQLARFKSSKAPDVNYGKSYSGKDKNGKHKSNGFGDWKNNTNFIYDVENFNQFGPVIRAKWMDKRNISPIKLNEAQNDAQTKGTTVEEKILHKTDKNVKKRKESFKADFKHKLF